MNIEEIDRTISSLMQRWGTQALCGSFGNYFHIVLILKPLGISAAEPLVIATVHKIDEAPDKPLNTDAEDDHG